MANVTKYVCVRCADEEYEEYILADLHCHGPHQENINFDEYLKKAKKANRRKRKCRVCNDILPSRKHFTTHIKEKHNIVSY